MDLSSLWFASIVGVLGQQPVTLWPLGSLLSSQARLTRLSIPCPALSASVQLSFEMQVVGSQPQILPGRGTRLNS